MYYCSKIWIGGDINIIKKVSKFLLERGYQWIGQENDSFLDSDNNNISFIAIDDLGQIKYGCDYDEYFFNKYCPTYKKYHWNQILLPIGPKRKVPTLEFLPKQKRNHQDLVDAIRHAADVTRDIENSSKKWYGRLWDKIKKPFKKISNGVKIFWNGMVKRYPYTLILLLTLFSISSLVTLVDGFSRGGLFFICLFISWGLFTIESSERDD